MIPATQAPTLARLSHLLGDVRPVLQTIRKYLHMDVAFITRFDVDDRIFEHVDDDGQGPIAVGQRIVLTDGYCLKVVNGELPVCIPDTSNVPVAWAMQETRTFRIGAHLGVPIVLRSGALYGTLCCFSHLPKSSLCESDVQLIRALAEVVAARIDENLAAVQPRCRTAEEITALIARGSLRMVYQPIFRIDDGRLAGFESLARFDDESRQRPDEWFDAAHRVGVGLDLEAHAISAALAGQAQMPCSAYLAINASADMLLSDRLGAVLSDVDPSGIVVELTEHAVVNDYDALAAALRPWRRRGLRLAVDDAGAGFSTLRHILHLDPDIIKLDMSLTRAIDRDPKRRALAKGLTTFAHEIGCSVIAEGVETEAELGVLGEVGVDNAQGYHLARPEPLDRALSGLRQRTSGQCNKAA